VCFCLERKRKRKKKKSADAEREGNAVSHIGNSVASRRAISTTASMVEHTGPPPPPRSTIDEDELGGVNEESMLGAKSGWNMRSGMARQVGLQFMSR